MPIIGTSPDSDRRRRRPRALPEAAARAGPAPAAERAPRAPKTEALEQAARARLSAGGAPELRAGRPRDGNRARAARPRALHARGGQGVSNDSPVLLDRFLNDAIEVRRRLHARRRRRRLLIGGVMEHIEQAGVHSGDSACSLPPYSPEGRYHGRAASARRVAMAKALNVVGLMNVQFAIQAEGRPGRHLRARSEPARLAHRAVRARRPPAIPLAKIAARCMAGQIAASRRASRKEVIAAVLQREGSRVPVRQVPGRGHHPRPRDEVHRRSDGRGQDLRRSLREVADRRRHAACRSRARCSSR